jgi:hypothetical protein
VQEHQLCAPDAFRRACLAAQGRSGEGAFAFKNLIGQTLHGLAAHMARHIDMETPLSNS